MEINTLTQTTERTHDVYMENPKWEKNHGTPQNLNKITIDKGYNIVILNDLEL